MDTTMQSSTVLPESTMGQKNSVSGFQQFGALAYKNWLLKKRKWVSTALELMIPMLFMLGLRALGTNPDVIPAQTPGTTFPVPPLQFLYSQAVGSNVLCYDSNMFTRCSCSWDHSQSVSSVMQNYSVDNYFTPQGFSYPAEAYFQTSHSGQAYLGMCETLVTTTYFYASTTGSVILPDGTSICPFLPFLLDLCPTYIYNYDPAASFAGLSSLCGTPNVQPTVNATSTTADLGAIVDQGIALAAALGAGVAIPDQTALCEQQYLTLIPLGSGLQATSPTSSDAEAAALAFYVHLTQVVGLPASTLTNFTSEKDMENFVASSSYGQGDPSVIAIGPTVVFNGGSVAAPAWSYTLRFNYSLEFYVNSNEGYRNSRIPTTRSVTNAGFRDANSTTTDEVGMAVSPYNFAYYTAGVLSLQQELDTFLLRLQGTDPAAVLAYRVANFPSEPYETYDFWANVGDMLAIVMVLVLMYPVSNLISSIVLDKELKLKESMLQMGLKPFVYYFSWLFQFVIIFFVLAILLTLAGTGQVYKYSDPGIVFLVFFLFFLSTISFCFFISAFFSRTKSAATYGSLIFFASVFPFYAVNKDGTTGGARVAACLLPSTCYAVSTLPFAQFETNGIGITSATIASHADGMTISISQCLGMFIFDIFLYGFLFWYASEVVPSEWGTSRPWYFLVTKAYWFPGSSSSSGATVTEFQQDESDGHSDTVEPVSALLRRQVNDGTCVAIRGLTKTFPSPNGDIFRAVDNLNLTMYTNQITALLGHNGAGKSTTINMLSGMLPITAGKAMVNGFDVATNMKKIRTNMGVCPQHDTLYPDLTVEEHLRMFAAFKGIPRKRLHKEVKEMINAVGLVEKKNERSSTLSGGQKRKLSVGIAFIGGSKIVFLDEPTSGMDPFSRRFTWELIRKQKQGRVIILTTHFMDEADLLGDRIAMMSGGKLKCCGTSLFLKNIYGVGYLLTLVKRVSSKVDSNGDSEDADKQLAGASHEIKKLVKSIVPSAKVVSDVGAELSLQMPSAASATFPKLLETLDADKNKLCVTSYGLSITTLEQVFLQVAHGTDDPDQIATLRQRSQSIGHDGASDRKMRQTSEMGLAEGGAAAAAAAAAPHAVFKPQELPGNVVFKNHVKALLTKRARIFKRDRKTVCFVLLAPSFFLLLGCLILLITPAITQPALVMTLDDLNEGVAAPRNPIPYTTLCTVAGEVCQVTSLVTMLAPVVDAAGGGVLIPEADTSIASFEQTLQATQYDNEAMRYGAYTWESVEIDTKVDVAAIMVANFTALHAAPVYANMISTSILRMLTGNDAAGITVTMHPHQKTNTESTIDSDTNTFPQVIFLMIGYAFIPAAWVSFVVRERQHRSKHQQVVSGVSLEAYWCSTLMWDLFAFLPTPLICFALLEAFSSTSLVGASDTAGATFLLLFLYGPSMAGFSYCTSFLFTNHARSLTSTLLLNWVFGLMLPIMILFFIIFESTRSIGQVLQWVFRFCPAYCLGDGILGIGNRTFLALLTGEATVQPPFSRDIAGADIGFMVAGSFVYILVTLGLERWFAGTRTILSVFSDWKLKRRLNKIPDKDAMYDADFSSTGTTEDIDVIAERERVEGGGAKDDVIQIHGLRKVYTTSGKKLKVAVRNMWLGVPKGEVFGLLGINGAGKTTTIATLCGEIEPTDGSAMLVGLDVAKNVEKVHHLIGYCPQFDALFETLTVREHLELYARIKCLEADKILTAVECKIKEMDLSEYSDKFAGGLSGGNKRKLSVAIAMLGSPDIVFLDEPSTGVDPVARRHMWEVISRIVTGNRQCAMVLTTHSMEECEALCQRIGIMVGGRLQCLGSAQHLKTRFGKGYQMELTTALPKDDRVKEVADVLQNTAGAGNTDQKSITAAVSTAYPALDTSELNNLGRLDLTETAIWTVQELTCQQIVAYLTETFPGVQLVEKQGSKLRLELQVQEGVTLASIFAIIEQARTRLGIGDYTLGQTSLEQLFNIFAGRQLEETAPAPGQMAEGVPVAVEVSETNGKDEKV